MSSIQENFRWSYICDRRKYVMFVLLSVQLWTTHSNTLRFLDLSVIHLSEVQDHLRSASVDFSSIPIHSYRKWSQRNMHNLVAEASNCIGLSSRYLFMNEYKIHQCLFNLSGHFNYQVWLSGSFDRVSFSFNDLSRKCF